MAGVVTIKCQTHQQHVRVNPPSNHAVSIAARQVRGPPLLLFHSHHPIEVIRAKMITRKMISLQKTRARKYQESVDVVGGVIGQSHCHMRNRLNHRHTVRGRSQRKMVIPRHHHLFSLKNPVNHLIRKERVMRRDRVTPLVAG